MTAIEGPSSEFSYPFPPRSCLEPSEELDARRQAPVSEVVLDSGDTAWLVTRFVDGHAVLSDARFAIWFPGMPRDRVLDEEGGGFLFVMNGPDHLRVRRSVGAAMGGVHLQRVRRAAERIAAGRIAALVAADRPADVIAEVGVPLAAGCLAELLGVSDRLGQDLQRRAAEVVAVFAPPSSGQATTAETSLADWAAAALHAEDAHHGDGLLSALLSGHASSGAAPLTRDEVRNVVLTLLLGGLVPPARALGHGLLRLLRRPDLVTRLRDNPGLVPAVVEELLRLDHAVASSGLRLATEGVKIGSVTVSAGELVVVSLGAVNRDPARFTKPDEIDPDRADHSHLSFVAGPHRCLGASIARTQLAAALRAVLTIADPLLPVDEDRLQWRPSYFTDLFSVSQVPLAWRPYRESP